MKYHWNQMTLIFLLGFGMLGVLSRYLMDGLALHLFESPLPIGTFTINLLGSFIAGLLFVVGTEQMKLSPELRTGLLVGFCGGFTTFSSYSLQAATLLESGRWAWSLGYLFASPVLGLAAAFAGMALARSL